MNKTIKELLIESNNKLRSITDTPSLDASLLLEKATGLNKINQIINDNKIISEEEANTFNLLLNKRMNHEPIAYILGYKEFYSRNFKVTKNTLIPRPDTEILVEQVINYINTLDYSPDLLDLCTGTGCVGLSIALEAEIKELTLSDISEKALEVAKYNSENLYTKKVNLLKSNLLNKCAKYDIIVSNPPYLTKQWCDILDEDVKKEPILALEGFGDDGLDLIREIIKSSKTHFKGEKNAIFLECDSRQCNTVKTILIDNNFKDIEIIKDLGNRDRVVKGIYER